MVGWHHQLNGHESEQTPGDSEGRESLQCCGPWGHKESDPAERLNTRCSYSLIFKTHICVNKTMKTPSTSVFLRALENSLYA